MFVRNRLIRIVALGAYALLLVVAFAMALPTGVQGYYEAGCSSCHGASNGVVTFTFSGPPNLPHGSTGTYTLTINGGTGNAIGVDIGVSAGTLALVTTTNLALTSNEIYHTNPLPSRTVQFKVTAPASGSPVKIYYAAVSDFANNNHDSTLAPLPIQLSSFAVNVTSDKAAKLDWATTSEINNYGFAVQRKAAQEADFVEIPGVLIPGHGTTLAAQHYSYTDESVSLGDWSYRLRQIDLDGSSHLSGAVTVSIEPTVVSETPASCALLQNYPNPFNPSTTIRYTLAAPAHTTLSVFTVTGQKVATLVDEQQEAGQHSAQFRAPELASGIYLYRIQSGSFSETKKLVLTK
ncbi:MAG TPA: T9SS type A sorting domain-containing protein [Bacteroidota bacterium]|nr:T9SS type A sorting domain-containing protein [Bacteroidota bacterium]